MSNKWCGTHIYFDNKFKVDPNIKNSGIGATNLWNGTQKYFEDDFEIQTEIVSKYVIDLDLNIEYIQIDKKENKVYNLVK